MFFANFKLGTAADHMAIDVLTFVLKYVEWPISNGTTALDLDEVLW